VPKFSLLFLKLVYLSHKLLDVSLVTYFNLFLIYWLEDNLEMIYYGTDPLNNAGNHSVIGDSISCTSVVCLPKDFLSKFVCIVRSKDRNKSRYQSGDIRLFSSCGPDNDFSL
jgi:hypothetical protein